jgi:hypothetical protein
MLSGVRGEDGPEADPAAGALPRFLDKPVQPKLASLPVTAVVTRRSLAYRRPDGVLVVALATLGP